MNYFYGRKEILALIRKRVGDLKEGYRQNLALLGSRHVGKSAILQKFIRDIDDHAVMSLYFDLEGRDINYFVMKMARGILYQYAKSKGMPLHETLTALAESLMSAVPGTAKAALEAAILLDKNKLPAAYEAALRLPEILFQETNLFSVIVIDEFHQIDEFGINEPFKVLAERITLQKSSLFIITSSCEDRANRILAERLTLLFGNFELVTVSPFDLKSSQAFIESRSGHLRMGLHLRNFLADFTGGRPLYLDLLLHEIINLAAIHKQPEVYAPLVVQSIESLVFSRWGAISRHFELIIEGVCGGRPNRLVMEILFALVNGTHRAKDLVDLLGVKQAQVTQKLNFLVENDVIERNGTHVHVKDKLFRYWIKYVFQRRIKSIDLEIGSEMRDFKDELARALSQFQVTSRKDLSTRMTELVACFSNELLTLQGHLYRLPAFSEIRPIKIKARSGNFFDVLEAKTEDGIWLLVLRKDPVGEVDIHMVAEEARKMGVRPRRCVIVALSELDDTAKLKALEEHMWIWNEPEVNSLMNLYDQPYIVP
ncbi:MAG: ATP-binding protein [Candidatus Omnitrophica bacterium]|nr:ATP-binding protein [Candidatus Omnitrophota bacterium]